MPVTPDQMSRSARTRTLVSPIITKSSGAGNPGTLFFNRFHDIRVREITLVVVVALDTNDANIDLGITGDTDAFLDGVDFGSGIDAPASVAASTAGTRSTFVITNGIVPAGSALILVNNNSASTGSYFVIVDYEMVQEIPPINRS